MMRQSSTTASRSGKPATKQQAKPEQKGPSVAQQAKQPPALKKTLAAKTAPPKAMPKKSLGQAKLPDAPATRGLAMPKMKGKSSQELIESRLKKRSPWFSSIMDPLQGASCKIPDETGVETGTLQLVQRTTVKANEQGLAGCKIQCPYVNSVPNGSGVTSGINYQFISSDTSELTVYWNGGAASSSPVKGYPFDGVEDIQAISNQHRIVSCAIIVQPEAALATNSGEMTGFLADFSVSNSSLYQTYVNSYKSSVLPVNSNKALMVRWFPVKREDWSFKSFLRTNGSTFEFTDAEDAAVPYWNLGFIATGLADTTVFRVTMVVNYEFIPSYNTLNVLNAAPSPVDIVEQDLVENWVQTIPLSVPVSQNRAAASPGTVSPQHGEEPTGFGMFADVVDAILPFLGTAVSLL